MALKSGERDGRRIRRTVKLTSPLRKVTFLPRRAVRYTAMLKRHISHS